MLHYHVTIENPNYCSPALPSKELAIAIAREIEGDVVRCGEGDPEVIFKSSDEVEMEIIIITSSEGMLALIAH